MKVILTNTKTGKKIAIEIVDQGYWQVLRLRVIGSDGYCNNTFYTNLGEAISAGKRLRVMWIKEGFDREVFID